MAKLEPEGFLELTGPDGSLRLHALHSGPAPEAAPTLVLLHEGLGAATAWGDLPNRLSERTGAGVVAVSRAGYGRSSPTALPRPLDYVRREALEVLPRVLDAIGFRRGLLVGHSDGASIAAIYAGGVQDHRVRGLALIAPHFFVEDATTREIARVRADFASGQLRERLARHHDDPDAAFRGWNDAWLDPAFPAAFDLVESLAYIRVPLLIVQGEADPYGTARQHAVAAEECYCPVEVLSLPGCGHAPHRERPDETLEVLAGFVERILTFHGEAAMMRAA